MHIFKLPHLPGIQNAPERIIDLQHTMRGIECILDPIICIGVENNSLIRIYWFMIVGADVACSIQNSINRFSINIQVTFDKYDLIRFVIQSLFNTEIQAVSRRKISIMVIADKSEL